MLIKAAFCSLIRFRCPGCGKTFCFYPDFAIPYKHYTRALFDQSNPVLPDRRDHPLCGGDRVTHSCPAIRPEPFTGSGAADVFVGQGDSSEGRQTISCLELAEVQTDVLVKKFFVNLGWSNK